jgi:RNA polymerase sigma factor (sigma-70 family)
MPEDAELLRRYAAEHSEAAFAELARRHLDLVYCAAFRLLGGDPHRAQDVTQQVFAELARQAERLIHHPVLVGWLYTTTRRMALSLNRADRRRRAREQEATTMSELLRDDAPEQDWALLRPVLEDAMHELHESDCHAVLLRFFQNKTLNEVGTALGLSENAARMRVDRALDKLRGKLVRRGITTTALSLSATLSAHAVQAAPAGLAATVSAAAALAGKALATTAATATATKAIAMTTLQKALVAAVFAATVSTGIYEAHQASALRGQVETLEQQQAPLAARNQELTRDRDETERQLAMLNDENERLKRNTSELLALRAEVVQLRSRAGMAATADDPMQSAAKSLVERVRILQEKLDATPSAKIPELQLLTAGDWADAARGNLDTEDDFRKAFSTLRDWAVRNFLQSMSSALRKYKQTHHDDVPPELSDLKPFFETAPSDEMLQRYQIVSSKVLPSFSAEGRSGQGWSVTLKEVIDADNDALVELTRDGGVGSASYRDVAALKVLEPAMRAFEANAPTNAEGHLAFTPQQLLPYLKTPEEKAAYEKLTRSRSPDLK